MTLVLLLQSSFLFIGFLLSYATVYLGMLFFHLSPKLYTHY